LVTGGAGFLGSHLCRALVARGSEIVAIDNLASGDAENVRDLLGQPRFALVEHDVTRGIPVEGAFDAVLHLASIPSPPQYMARPIEALLSASAGTINALELARANGARFLLASTSEVYGEPAEHPQTERYWGNVNPVGPRAAYDEGKRYAEALAMAFHRVHGLDAKIARIFNTYGPGLHPADGRAVSNFLVQAMSGQPVTVHGDGSQTRSFCYVDDLIAGLVALLESDWIGPMNIGNPIEHTVLEVAELVVAIVGSGSSIVFEPRPVDDPSRRCPDISLAREILGWNPVVPLRDGLGRVFDWYSQLDERAMGAEGR
jgi:dTDP-glucose 4,6-dehydratase